jgi:hypothetical protein
MNHGKGNGNLVKPVYDKAKAYPGFPDGEQHYRNGSGDQVEG